MKRRPLTPKIILLTLLWLIATICLMIYQINISFKPESKLLSNQKETDKQVKIPVTGAFQALGRYSFQSYFTILLFIALTFGRASIRRHQLSGYKSVKKSSGQRPKICIERRVDY